MRPAFCFVVFALWAVVQARGATFQIDFSGPGLPPGTVRFGSAEWDATGGVDGGGVVKLTRALSGQEGSLIIEGVDGFNEVNGFDATFKMFVSGGTEPPADGFSFNFSADILPDASFGEEGTGTGVTIAFDVFDNGGGEAPAIDVKFLGQTIAHTLVSIPDLRTEGAFVEVHVVVEGDGTLDLTYDGQQYYSDLFIPDYSTFVGGQFGFGARTGGLNVNQWVDDISITTTSGAKLLGFILEPEDCIGILGKSVTFFTQVNDPGLIAACQWQRKNPGATTFSDIPGATGATFETGLLSIADDGALFRVRITAVGGASQTSREALLQTVEVLLDSPDVTYDFNQGQPAGTAAHGSAFIDPASRISVRISFRTIQSV